MTCPGSVKLIKFTGLADDESEFAAEGTAAHELASTCLADDTDPWEHIGQTFHDHKVDADMASHVQLYVDDCRRLMKPPAEHWIEYRISHMAHKLLFGTMDFAAYHPELETLAVRDLKYGAGIAVDADTPQLKYYAYGMLQVPGMDAVRYVDMAIVQPRAHHPDGPVRRLQLRAEDLHEWGQTVLLPAMRRTEKDNGLDVGSHCRFCPARFACPALTGLFSAFAVTPAASVGELSDELLGLAWRQIEPVRIFLKALETETMRRLSRGKPVAGLKLVDKYADRVYREGAERALRKALGDDIYTEPKLKSPAQLEKLGAKAKALAREWAYTPKTGQTVAPETDRRPRVKAMTASEAFKGLVNKDDW
jgi:hypothetical protein